MFYRFPDFFILATEACTGYSPLETRGPVLGSWERGERYSNSIIEVSARWFTIIFLLVHFCLYWMALYASISLIKFLNLPGGS